MTRNMEQTLPAGAAGAPVVPLGQTTVLSADDLARIKTTLLHADAKTQGTFIKSEVRPLRAPPEPRRGAPPPQRARARIHSAMGFCPLLLLTLAAAHTVTGGQPARDTARHVAGAHGRVE